MVCNGLIKVNLIDDTSKINVKMIDNSSKIDVKLTDYNDKGIRDDIEELRQTKVDKIEGKGLSTNDYTNEEKEKLSTLENYDDSEVRALIDTKQPRGDYALESEIPTKVSELENDEGYITTETDPTVPNHVKNITQNDITSWDNKADMSDIPDVSSFITKDVNNLTNYTLKTNTGSLIDLEINQTTYVVTLKLKDQDGNTISTDTIDLPLENVVVSGSYDETNQKIVLTLQSGDTVDIPVGALVSGLQSEITSSNKLASDLVDDSNSGNKFTTTSEKQTWNSKYTKPNGGIPKTDLSSDVQSSLDKADTAIQEHQSLTDYVKNTDYASSSTAGVIKLNASGYGTSVDSSGALRALIKNYEQYESSNSNYIIGKGTLENVIEGKGLITSSSDITGNASTSTTLKTFNYSRKGTNNTWAKVATASLVGTWEERHAYLFIKGTHNSNFKQNGIISIDAVGNGTKAKVNSCSAQFISASADLNLENFYIEYQDGNDNTPAILNFWVRNTTNIYASWQVKILQNTGWTIESSDTSVATLPTQDFTGKISELNNKTLKDKDGNDISTTYIKNTDYATQTTAGLMSSIDKTKLDDIQTGATKNLIFYGSCATGASSSAKVIVCEDFTATDLVAGTRLVVYFTNGNSYNGQATLNVNSTGAKNIYYNGTTTNARYMWVAGESVEFIYNGTQWATINGGLATTSYYGVTKLATGANSDSQAYALTPRSLYYFANYSICPYYSSSKTYAVGDKVRYTYYIYECITAIDEPEAWTAAHWQQVDTIQEQIDNKIWSGTEQQYDDLAEIKPDTLYCITE